jgi:hypothetical protein
MKVFQIDVRLYGTVFIRAETREEAEKKLTAVKGDWLAMDGGGESIEVSGADLDSDDLPEVSLSPAFTLIGPDADESLEVAE